jgi:nucleoid DNA-binding protein
MTTPSKGIRRKKSAMTDFCQFVSRNCHLPHPTTRAVMLAWRQFMTQQLTVGNIVYLEHFGKWKITVRGQSRIVTLRPPKKEGGRGEPRTVTIRPSLFISFKASKQLKSEVRKHYEATNPKPEKRD